MRIDVVGISRAEKAGREAGREEEEEEEEEEMSLMRMGRTDRELGKGRWKC